MCLASCLTTPAWARNSHLYSIFVLFLFLLEGTREGKTTSEGGGDWLTPIGETLKEIVVCKCCRPAQLEQPPTQAIEPPKVETKDVACQVNVDEIARNEVNNT